MFRLRVRFYRGEELKFISHLDTIRLWVRALRRAGIPLEYTEGFSPHPKISLAVPLSVGVTANNELMDISITKVVSPHWFMDTVNRQLPAGLKVLEAAPIGIIDSSPLRPALLHSGRGCPLVSGAHGSAARPTRNTRHIVTPAYRMGSACDAKTEPVRYPKLTGPAAASPRPTL